MPSRKVRYWHKVSDTAYEPLAYNKVGLRIEMEARSLVWCTTCRAAVEPEGCQDATGLQDVCPFCGEAIQ